MRRWSWFVMVLVVALAVMPAFAQSRAGGGYSMGSRGSRTYTAPPATSTTPGGAAPFQQSTTVPGGNYAGSSYGGGYGGGYGYHRSGFGRGMMGGLLGFGIGSMLFGHRGFGGGLGVFGLLIRLVLLFFVGRWLLRLVFRRGGGGFAPPIQTSPVGYGVPQSAPMLTDARVSVQAADYQAFEVLLKNIQAAWSNNDLNALRGFATPEMVSYFAEQLAANASRGVRNIVSNVVLQQGDLSEAWQEADRSYATVAMRFAMTDATYDQAGHVVDGSTSEHVVVSEYWTFLRAAGGHWVLSAIQQAR